MSYNEDLIKRLANGDVAAEEELTNLPTTVKMGIAIAVDNYRTKNDIQQADGLSIYEKRKASTLDGDEVGKALAKRLEETRIKEEILRKQREEDDKKRGEQMAARARALGSYQK